MMEKKLKKLFDFQSFSGNKEIEKMMKEAESRYPAMMSDDDLAFVAAGVEHPLSEEEQETRRKKEIKDN